MSTSNGLLAKCQSSTSLKICHQQQKKLQKKSSKPSIIDKCQHDLDASSKLTQLWNCFEKMRRLKKWTYILLFYVQVWPCCRICRLRGLKSDTTLFHWLGNSTPTFSQYYFNYFVTKQPRNSLISDNYTLHKPALFSGMTTKLLVKFSACLPWHNKKQLKFLCVSTKKWFSSWEQAARLVVLLMPQLADEGAPHTCARAPPEVWQSRPASRTQLNAPSHAWLSAMVYQRT